MNILQMSLSSIDIDNLDYIVSYPVESEVVAVSIRNIGVQHPVLLQKRGEKYVVISGMRRVRACSMLGHESISARVWDGPPKADVYFFHALYENMAHRTFNEIEKARIIYTLINELKLENDIIQKTCSLLGVDYSEYSLHVFLSIHKLDDTLKEMVFRKRLHVHTAIDLMRFEKSERDVLLDEIISLGMNANTARDFIVYCKEIIIAKREGIDSIGELFSAIGFDKISNDNDMPKKIKQDMIRQRLHALRYPVLQKEEDGFRELVQSLSLPGGANISHVPFFEREGYTLHMPFKTREEFLTKIRKIVFN